jgi:tetratricopeptide (TPR) repeat protein
MQRKFLPLVVLLLAPISALAQNSLRPGTFKPGDAKPIPAVRQPKLAPPKEETAGDPSVKPAAAQESDTKSAQEARLLLNEASQISPTAKSVEQFTEVIELCRRASEKQLTAEEKKYARDLRSWAYNKRGEVYAAQAAEFVAAGSDKEGARLDRQALDDFKASVALDPLRWKAWHNRGVSYGVLGLTENAIGDFSHVIKLKPDHANAWFNRAELFAELGKLNEAIRDYDEVLRLRPEDAAAWRQRGRAHNRAGKTQLALDDFDRAVQLNRNDLVSLVERGEIYLSLQDWESADTDFRAAIELDPDFAEAYRGLAWLLATCPQVKYRNAPIALEMAEQAVELATAQEKLDYTYHDTLAAAQANASRFADAQRSAQRAIAAAPAADAAQLKHRLTLYNAHRPYREPSVASVQPASMPVRR